jgi:hypothetical protein
MFGFSSNKKLFKWEKVSINGTNLFKYLTMSDEFFSGLS